MNKLYLSLILTICMYSLLTAQQISSDNQFIINKYSLSPAYAGYSQNFEVFATYRNEWVGIEDAPLKQIISANSSPYKNMGIGGIITNEKVGIYTNLSVMISYAYEVDLSSIQKLRFGLSAGLFNTQLDFSQNNPNEPIDPVIIKNQLQNGSAFDLSFGLLYQYDKLNVGVHVPRLLESEIKSDIEENKILYTLKRHYIAHILYNLEATPEINFEPIVIIHKTANSSLHYTVSLLGKYKDMLWAGVLHRKKSTMGANLGGAYKSFNFNYTYEFSGGTLAESSHEISIGYILGRSKEKSIRSKNKPYYNW